MVNCLTSILSVLAVLFPEFSTSALYSTPSKTRGTRLMVMSEVALGHCRDYTTIDTTLTKPPEGYDSVHGVGRKQENSSHFEVITDCFIYHVKLY